MLNAGVKQTFKWPSSVTPHSHLDPLKFFRGVGWSLARAEIPRRQHLCLIRRLNKASFSALCPEDI